MGPRYPSWGTGKEALPLRSQKEAPTPSPCLVGRLSGAAGWSPFRLSVQQSISPSVHQSRVLQVEDIPVHGALGTQHSIALVCRRDSGDLTSPLQGPHRIVSMSLQGSGLVCRRNRVGRARPGVRSLSCACRLSQALGQRVLYSSVGQGASASNVTGETSGSLSSSPAPTHAGHTSPYSSLKAAFGPRGSHGQLSISETCAPWPGAGGPLQPAACRLLPLPCPAPSPPLTPARPTPISAAPLLEHLLPSHGLSAS